ncbi:hypothetical protein GCM10011579_095190 [Streptomyces albiflavescens]|uniref:Uncharacterized protein n=1 Tax=Streptomyces albiflavescens TaxID=1623582 RepID=A0A917YH06_9ACTN|nr:hypothetical protein GCM10011579_095190 [Streptomyces albiflavescens]
MARTWFTPSETKEGKSFVYKLVLTIIAFVMAAWTRLRRLVERVRTPRTAVWEDLHEDTAVTEGQRGPLGHRSRSNDGLQPGRA